MTRRLARLVIATAAAALLTVTTVVAVTAPAEASSPGKNGLIAFEMQGVIYSIKSTGAGVTPLTSGPDDHSPRWSPDGKTIAFERGGDLWLMRANGSHQTRLTSGPGDDITPAWSPDGSKIVFVRSDDGSVAGRSMFVKPVAGGLPTRLIPGDDGCAYAPTWTSDGRYVVYSDECQLGRPRSVRKILLRTGVISDVIGPLGVAGPGGQWTFEGSTPDVTPDGQNVVFTVGSPSGICGVGITDLSGAGFRQVAQSADCGAFLADDPAVSPDGKKLAYTAGDETPQLRVVLTRLSDQSAGTIFTGGNYFPLSADWQPKH